MENNRIPKGEMLSRCFKYDDSLNAKAKELFIKNDLRSIFDLNKLHKKNIDDFKKFERLRSRQKRIQNFITYTVLER